MSITIILLTYAQLLLIFSLFLLFLACDPVYASAKVETTQVPVAEIVFVPFSSYGRTSILRHLPKRGDNA